MRPRGILCCDWEKLGKKEMLDLLGKKTADWTQNITNTLFKLDELIVDLFSVTFATGKARLKLP